jgi:hypothetical protein
MIVRKTFPQVYVLEHPKTKDKYWLCSARSAKWGSVSVHVRVPSGSSPFNVPFAMALAIGTDFPNERAVVVLVGELRFITGGEHESQGSLRFCRHAELHSGRSDGRFVSL